ncbi:hypothetical protein LCGC14_2586370 [marine sediment metagenome]|uniref:Uncharacterized protein n=1 Tax=marine sediment metagenome TaxID=412755 RepID=A0A0F9ADC5_9ZZZZ
MYVSLVERQHVPPEKIAGSIKWQPAHVEWVYLRTERATVKNLEKIRAERLKRLAAGEDVFMITSRIKPGDKRHGVNRRVRRHNASIARRLLPKLKAQLRRDQARVEKVLSEEFASRGMKKGKKAATPVEERTEGGVILPKGVKAPRKTRKRGAVA